MKRSILIPALAAVLSISASAAPAAGKPLKALLILGGCCHDYKVQKDILKAGIEERTNITVDICFSPDTSTKATFTCYEKENWAEGYDVIIHDECSADIKDLAVVNRILAPHRAGTPGVNLHCAMHCYRTAADVGKPQDSGTDGALWFDYLGLQSSGHGAQLPIDVTYVDPASPITKGLENWTTIKEELYNWRPDVRPNVLGKFDELADDASGGAWDVVGGRSGGVGDGVDGAASGALTGSRPTGATTAPPRRRCAAGAVAAAASLHAA
jgi:hypothetical protein